MDKIKLGIVDDHEGLRDAIIRLLGMVPDIEVGLTAENGVDLMEKLVDNQPDVLLMDIRMPKMDGIEATSKVVKEYPSVKVIMHSHYDDEHSVVELYELGARNFLSKGCDLQELIHAVRVVNNGGNYVTDETISIFRKYLKNGLEADSATNEVDEGLNKLTPIELKILWHTALLKQIKEIADDLDLSPHTVNNHHANIRKKFNLKGRNTIVQFAVAVREKLDAMLPNQD